MSVEVELNLDGLIAISNEVNDRVCGPLAQQVATAVAGAVVEVDQRAGGTDWARTKVVVPTEPRSNLSALYRALDGAQQ